MHSLDDIAVLKQLDMTAAQLLVTDKDFGESAFRKQLSETVYSLLSMKVVPIFNENDAISTRRAPYEVSLSTLLLLGFSFFYWMVRSIVRILFRGWSVHIRYLLRREIQNMIFACNILDPFCCMLVFILFGVLFILEVILMLSFSFSYFYHIIHVYTVTC